MKHLGELLKKARIEQELPIAVLAEHLNVKPITLYKIESGENFPSVEILSEYYFLLKIDLNKAMWLIKKEKK
jgi:transcriptional regulator with XRE-family HTH domain